MSFELKFFYIKYNMDSNKMKKCLKSYLTAKKYYESDVEKSYDYFKQCMNILNDLKKKRKNR